MTADLHCDTISEIYRKKLTLKENNLMIDIKKLKNSNVILQCFAMFTCISDISAPYKYVNSLIDLYEEEIKKNQSEIDFAKSYDDILKNIDKNIPFGWGDERQEVVDMSLTSHKYFVRFKGRDTEFIERCKKIFNDAKEVFLEGKDEFALVTGMMQEKDFLEALNNQSGVIKYIRTKIV